MFIAPMMVRTTGFGHESFCFVGFHVEISGLYLCETERYAGFATVPSPPESIGWAFTTAAMSNVQPRRASSSPSPSPSVPYSFSSSPSQSSSHSRPVLHLISSSHECAFDRLSVPFDQLDSSPSILGVGVGVRVTRGDGRVDGSNHDSTSRAQQGS